MSVITILSNGMDSSGFVDGSGTGVGSYLAVAASLAELGWICSMLNGRTGSSSRRRRQSLLIVISRYSGLCCFNQRRALHTLTALTAKGFACSRSHSGVGAEDPTNKTQTGAVISSMDG